MNALVLLIWISLIVVLHVRADEISASPTTPTNDHNEFCAHCNDATYPACPTKEQWSYNLTIQCQNDNNTPCIIAVAPPNDDNGTDFMCLIKSGMESTNMLEGDDIKVISTIHEPLQTMLPVPLAIQMAPTESSLSADDISKTEDVDAKEVDKDESEDITSKPLQDSSPSIIVDPLTIAPEMQATSTPAKEDPESNGSKPDDIADYPADAPLAEPHQLIQPVTPDDAEIEVQEIIEQDPPKVEVTVKPILQTEDVLENKVTDSPNDMTSEKNGAVEDEDKNTESVGEKEPDGNTIEQNVNAMHAGSGAPNLEVHICFGCISTDDASCRTKPLKQTTCKAMEDMQNGCYTLLKVDTNTTTRGCMSDLTEEGLKYCKSHIKFCSLCFTQGCNNRTAPSNAANIGAEALVTAVFVIITLLFN